MGRPAWRDRVASRRDEFLNARLGIRYRGSPSLSRVCQVPIRRWGLFRIFRKFFQFPPFGGLPPFPRFPPFGEPVLSSEFFRRRLGRIFEKAFPRKGLRDFGIVLRSDGRTAPSFRSARNVFGIPGNPFHDFRERLRFGVGVLRVRCRRRPFRNLIRRLVGGIFLQEGLRDQRPCQIRHGRAPARYRCLEFRRLERKRAFFLIARPGVRFLCWGVGRPFGLFLLRAIGRGGFRGLPKPFLRRDRRYEIPVEHALRLPVRHRRARLPRPSCEGARRFRLDARAGRVRRRRYRIREKPKPQRVRGED